MKSLFKSITFFILIILLCACTPVFASASISLEVETDKTELYKGQELLLTIKLSDSVDVEKGLNAYEATLDYDKNVFEKVTIENFTTENDWESLKYNPENNKFVAIKPQGSKVAEDLVTIRLVVKEDTNLQNTELGVKNFAISEGKEDLEPSNIVDANKVSTNITIIEESGVLPDKPDNKPENNEQPNTTNPTEKPNHYTGIKLPNTGVFEVNSWIIIIAAVVGMIAVFTKTADAQISLRNKRKQRKVTHKAYIVSNNKIKRIRKIAILILLVILLSQIVRTVSAASLKGEVNGDNEINYDDVYLLEECLIETSQIDTKYIKNADLNDDNYITVTDLSLLIQRIEENEPEKEEPETPGEAEDNNNDKEDEKGDNEENKPGENEKEDNEDGEDTDEPDTTEPTAEIENVSLSKEFVEKKEDFTVIYKINTNQKDDITHIRVNNNKVEATKKSDGTYTITLTAPNDAGILELKTVSVFFNEKEVSIEDIQNTIEVLKDAPTAEIVNYERNNNNTITVNIKISDDENSFRSAVITIVDENDVELITRNTETKEVVITFNEPEGDFYKVKVSATYDRDNNADNDKNEKTSVILEEKLEVAERMLEMKEIEDVTLYKKSGNNIEVQQTASLSEINNSKNAYMVRVDMEKLPTFYAGISEAFEENGMLKLALDFENVVQYTAGGKQDRLVVDYGEVHNGTGTRKTVDTIINEIKTLNNGTYELTQDIDMSKLTLETGNTIISETFTGTINGNGHTIKNLNKTLFSLTNGATIKNLIIEDATITGQGTITVRAENTTISNVHVKNLNLKTNANESGSFAGVITTNSVIENSSATGINITGGNKRTGGFVGAMGASIVRNSYVEGTLNCTQDGIGGISGSAENGSRIENSIAKMNFNTTSGPGYNGGIIGHSMNLYIENVLSLSTGEKGGKINGTGLNGSSKNYFALTESTLTEGNEQSVAKANINKAFFKDQLHLDESIWNLENASYDNLPSLKGNDPRNQAQEEKLANENLYIPDYAILKAQDNYDTNKEIAYSNIYKLMPFYDSKYILVDGEKVGADDILNTKNIKGIIPFNAEGKAIVGLTLADNSKINKIKVVFEDDEVKEYALKYRDTKGSIANYELQGLKVGYNYNKYLVDTESSLFKGILNTVTSTNYNQLNELTEEDENRNFVLNYDKVLENKNAFVANLMANNAEYNGNTELAKQKILNDMTNNNLLKKILYTYNYFDKYYDIEIGGINMRDVVYFDTLVFSNNTNAISRTNEMLAVNSSERMTELNKLVEYYNNHLKSSLNNLGLANFLEYFIVNLTTEKYKEQPTEWIMDNYSGIIYEAPAKDYTEIRYKVWDHFKNREMLILPILSYKGNDMYVVSVPTNIFVGDIKNYDNPWATEEAKRTGFEAFVKNSTTMYNTLFSVVSQETRDRANGITAINFDTTGNTNWTNKEGASPVYIAFNETLGRWPVHGSAAAYADGTDVYWMYHAMRFYNIWTHENLHNQDGRLFLDGYGRRAYGGAEMFTDGFLTQSTNQYDLYANLTYDLSATQDASFNLTPERITGRENIDSYFKNAYEVIDALNYLEGLAFVQLTPYEQSKIAQRIVQRDEGNITRISYENLTEEQFADMNLKTTGLRGLWDNKLAVNRGYTGLLGGSRWYYPASEVGINETLFKGESAHILGQFGYAGFVTYSSGARYDATTKQNIAGDRLTNDIQIIKELTGDQTMTWEKFFFDRYETIKTMLDNSAIDADAIVKEMVEAMKIDVARGNDFVSYTSYTDESSEVNLRKTLFGILKRKTNDFETSAFAGENTLTNVKRISNANDLIKLGKETFTGKVILTNNIDMTGVSVQDTVLGDFTGSFDGNNKYIKGLKAPLFANVAYAEVKNLEIKDSTIELEQTYLGAFARTIKNANIENIKINNVTVEGKIHSGNITSAGTFAGSISKSYIKNVSVNNVNVTTVGHDAGGFVGRIDNSYISDSSIIGATVSGNARVGGFAGYANRIYKIENVDANANITARASESGVFVGQLDSSNVVSSYALGSVTSEGNNAGGFVGKAQNTTIDKSYSNVDVKSTRNNAGGFIGNAQGTTVVTNSVAFGPVNGGYKFDGNSAEDIINTYENNYEYEETAGKATSERNESFNSKILTIKNLPNADFYKNTLNWNADVWNLSNVGENGVLPKLKNALDTNTPTVIVDKISISNLDEFIAKISENLDKRFTITQNIDMSAYNESTNVITGTFTGQIDGNGYTLSNLNGAALFQQFNGTVKDLNISNFTNEQSLTTDNVAAFAVYTNNASFANMKFSDITLKGQHRVSVVSTTDQSNSTFNKITVENANVTGTGVYVSTFVGRKYSGAVRNCYVQGTIVCNSTEAGGITGASQNGGQFENVIANVNMVRESNTDGQRRNNNGGFVGNIYNSPRFKNCISIGTMTGYESEGATIYPYKFSGASEENNQNYLENCYEVSDRAGATSITSNTSSVLKTISSSQLNETFYKNTLGFNENIWDFSNMNGHPKLK